VTFGTMFARGKEDVPECLRFDDYKRNMNEATTFKVTSVLSDFETQQHWLADSASVILHLFRTWLTGRRTNNVTERDVAKEIRSSVLTMDCESRTTFSPARRT
jgi:hypothetical protein